MIFLYSKLSKYTNIYPHTHCSQTSKTETKTNIHYTKQCHLESSLSVSALLFVTVVMAFTQYQQQHLLLSGDFLLKKLRCDLLTCCNLALSLAHNNYNSLERQADTCMPCTRGCITKSAFIVPWENTVAFHGLISEELNDSPLFYISFLLLPPLFCSHSFLLGQWCPMLMELYLVGIQIQQVINLAS